MLLKINKQQRGITHKHRKINKQNNVDRKQDDRKIILRQANSPRSRKRISWGKKKTVIDMKRPIATQEAFMENNPLLQK